MKSLKESILDDMEDVLNNGDKCCKDIIKDFIQVQIHKYKIKHRFDKPPIAKCYCIDCKNCKEEKHSGRWCYRFDRCVADNWFCWEAEPDLRRRS